MIKIQVCQLFLRVSSNAFMVGHCSEKLKTKKKFNNLAHSSLIVVFISYSVGHKLIMACHFIRDDL